MANFFLAIFHSRELSKTVNCTFTAPSFFLCSLRIYNNQYRNNGTVLVKLFYSAPVGLALLKNQSVPEEIVPLSDGINLISNIHLGRWFWRCGRLGAEKVIKLTIMTRHKELTYLSAMPQLSVIRGSGRGRTKEEEEQQKVNWMCQMEINPLLIKFYLSLLLILIVILLWLYPHYFNFS